MIGMRYAGQNMDIYFRWSPTRRVEHYTESCWKWQSRCQKLRNMSPCPDILKQDNKTFKQKDNSWDWNSMPCIHFRQTWGNGQFMLFKWKSTIKEADNTYGGQWAGDCRQNKRRCEMARTKNLCKGGYDRAKVNGKWYDQKPDSWVYSDWNKGSCYLKKSFKGQKLDIKIRWIGGKTDKVDTYNLNCNVFQKRCREMKSYPACPQIIKPKPAGYVFPREPKDDLNYKAIKCFTKRTRYGPVLDVEYPTDDVSKSQNIDGFAIDCRQYKNRCAKLDNIKMCDKNRNDYWVNIKDYMGPKVQQDEDDEKYKEKGSCLSYIVTWGIEVMGYWKKGGKGEFTRFLHNCSKLARKCEWFRRLPTCNMGQIKQPNLWLRNGKQTKDVWTPDVYKTGIKCFKSIHMDGLVMNASLTAAKQHVFYDGTHHQEWKVDCRYNRNRCFRFIYMKRCPNGKFTERIGNKIYPQKDDGWGYEGVYNTACTRFNTFNGEYFNGQFQWYSDEKKKGETQKIPCKDWQFRCDYLKALPACSSWKIKEKYTPVDKDKTDYKDFVCGRKLTMNGDMMQFLWKTNKKHLGSPMWGSTLDCRREPARCLNYRKIKPCEGVKYDNLTENLKNYVKEMEAKAAEARKAKRKADCGKIITNFKNAKSKWINHINGWNKELETETDKEIIETYNGNIKILGGFIKRILNTEGTKLNKCYVFYKKNKYSLVFFANKGFNEKFFNDM